jgi:hypothetical protein
MSILKPYREKQIFGKSLSDEIISRILKTYNETIDKGVLPVRLKLYSDYEEWNNYSSELSKINNDIPINESDKGRINWTVQDDYEYYKQGRRQFYGGEMEKYIVNIRNLSVGEYSSIISMISDYIYYFSNSILYNSIAAKNTTEKDIYNFLSILNGFLLKIINSNFLFEAKFINRDSGRGVKEFLKEYIDSREAFSKIYSYQDALFVKPLWEAINSYFASSVFNFKDEKNIYNFIIEDAYSLLNKELRNAIGHSINNYEKYGYMPKKTTVNVEQKSVLFKNVLKLGGYNNDLKHKYPAIESPIYASTLNNVLDNGAVIEHFFKIVRENSSEDGFTINIDEVEKKIKSEINCYSRETKEYLLSLFTAYDVVIDSKGEVNTVDGKHKFERIQLLSILFPEQFDLPYHFKKISESMLGLKMNLANNYTKFQLANMISDSFAKLLLSKNIIEEE